MPERNAVQAMFPEGSEPIANPRGTAPGIWMEVPRKGKPTPSLMAALPGVPSEMKWMFLHEVLPRLPGTGLPLIDPEASTLPSRRGRPVSAESE
jgi:nicotinamide-nucleotide amidase